MKRVVLLLSSRCARLSLRRRRCRRRYQQVLDTLGKQGDFKDNVLKVNIPRNDLSITVANVKTPTPFGFGGWVAMTKGTGGMDVMMGDLVLTQDEVNPVMSALLDNGLEVTALHNHFFWDEPRMFYMHVHGHGSPADLARKVKPALDLIGKGGQPRGCRRPRRRAAPAPAIDTAKIAQIAGHQGETNGAVYKITVGRDDLKLTEMGAPINARMGLNTWAAFVGTNDNAAIAGDVAMLAERSDAGAQGAAAERPRRRRDSPPHDRHEPDDLLPALLGHRPGGQAGGRLQGGARRTWCDQASASR